jgi:hypothetical protein
VTLRIASDHTAVIDGISARLRAAIVGGTAPQAP